MKRPTATCPKSLFTFFVSVVAAIFLSVSVAHIPAQTQAAINAQARADFAKADVDLNKTYQAVLAKLPPNEKQKLREAQRAWVASRDAEGAEAAKETEGSIGPTVRYGRMTELTRKRIDELNAMIGRESSPTKASPSPNNQVSSVSQAEPTARPTPDPISPDKKWEFASGNAPELLEAETKEAVVEFSCGGGGSGLSAPVWAPNSKRFAISCAGGKVTDTSVYQLRDDRWVAPEEVLGNGDELMDQVGNLVGAQAKKKGMPKHTFLHMQWWTVEPKQWLDANTLVVYASMAERAHYNNGEDAGAGFGADALVTLRFDEAGKWKIVKTHRLSEKEIKQREKERMKRRYIWLVGILIVLISPGAFAQNDFAAFWKKFSSAVTAGDKAAVAEMTKFPLSMPYGVKAVKTKSDFLRRYDEIFNGEANAAQCFRNAKPQKESGRYEIYCPFKGTPNDKENTPIRYVFELTKSGWKFAGLDNINE